MMKVDFKKYFKNNLENILEPPETQLAIGGPEAWTALAIREDTTIAKTKTEIAPKPKQKSDKNKQVAHRRKGKGRKTKYSSGPKV